MWTITSQKTGDAYCLLLGKQKYSFGRSNVDIILKDDSSISRVHAYIYLSETDIKIIDNNSKYGIFLNENIENKKCIEKNKQYKLCSNDRIKFGVLENEWILKKIQLNTLISTLNIDAKRNLQNVLKYLNGTIAEKLTVDQKTTYSHLTMEKITVTTKLLYALTDKLQIVNCRYWIDLLSAAKNNEKLPKPDNYIPIISEEFIHINKDLLLSNVDRKNLFANKIFYFTNSRHMRDYVPIITKIGGKVQSVNESISKPLFLDPNAIVIHNKSLTQSQAQGSEAVNILGDFLNKNSLRLVPDFEIGLAVLYNSIKKHCNPNFKAIHTVCEPNKYFPSTSNIIAEETPQINEQAFSDQQHNSVEIPESEMSNKKENIVSVEAEMIVDLSSDDDFHLLIETSDQQLLSEKNNKFNGNEQPNDNIGAKVEVEKSNNNALENCKQNLPNNRICSKQKYSKSPEIPEPPTKKTHLDLSEPKQSNCNLTGFLSKSLLSQRIAANPELIENMSQMTLQPPKSQTQKKRGRFATLDSDDENDEHLFNFGGAAKKPKSQTPPNTTPLFGFKKEKQKKSNNVNSNITVPSAMTSTTSTSKIIDSETITRTNYTPIDLTSASWLSKSTIKLDLTKIEEEEKKLDPKEIKYIESIKNGFEVRTKPMPLSSRFLKNTTNASSGSSAGSGKNFKGFKKQNYVVQNEVIKTVPFHISGYDF